MDQWLNVFGQTFEAMEKVFQDIRRGDKKAGDIVYMLQKTLMDGTLFTGFLENLMKKMKISVPESHTLEHLQLYTFPEILYRRLLSYQTTNWYILPYSGKIDFGSRG